MKLNLKSTIPLVAVLLIVFIFYLPSIFFGIKAFDESILLKESYLPVCYSISEIIELISNLGLHQHFEAANTLYSNIVSVRCNPFNTLLVLITQLILQKNILLYHLYSLVLHLANTALFFLILQKAASIHFKKANSKLTTLIICLFTLLWAIHPVNIESVLLLTNYTAILSYTLCLLTAYFYITSLEKKHIPPIQHLLITVPFFISLFIAEYLFALPFIIFCYSLTVRTIKSSLKLTLPLFLADLIFIISFLLSNTKVNLQISESIQTTLERVFWLSPQVFFHFIKLLIFPLKLSIDQSTLVKLGTSLFDPYAVFCLLFLILLITLASILVIKKKNYFLFILVFPLLIALFPFSHILAPIYNLASERYLYLPSFVFIFGIAYFIFYIVSKNQKKAISICIILGICTLMYSSRAFTRLLDWKNTTTLYTSAIHATNSLLAKAFRYKSLTPEEKLFSQLPHREVNPKYQELAIKHLKKAVSIYEEQIDLYQDSIPSIVKVYGLDPLTLYGKSKYLLAHSDYLLNDKPQTAIKTLRPIIEKNILTDAGALAFYGSLLVKEEKLQKAEATYRLAYKHNPYSTQIIFPLSQLIYLCDGSLEEVEKLCAKSFKHFPYDVYTLLFLIKINKLKNDQENFAYYSYIYGLRQHKIEYLQNAYSIYSSLNKTKEAKQIYKRILSFYKDATQKLSK